MNAVLENLMVALDDELQFCFKERFGTTQEWPEIGAYDKMKIIVAQVQADSLLAFLSVRHYRPSRFPSAS